MNIKQNPIIIGAGLAGLVAANVWPAAQIIEAAQEPRALHRALLRFRSDSVANLTGIEFRKVLVSKGIYSQGCFVGPNIRLANRYTKKVTGRLSGDRSILDIAPVVRYIAPDTFYEQLITAAQLRIFWNTKADFDKIRTPHISTAPLPVVLNELGIQTDMQFERAPITVVRCRVRGADLFQTIYFPDDETPMYRASITGETLIIEAMTTDVAAKEWLPRALVLVERAFGLERAWGTEGVQVMETVQQQYGKIVPISDSDRKSILFSLTQKRSIYSLGRFATWRNILLDDVVKDAYAIKKMMNSQPYDVMRSIA